MTCPGIHTRYSLESLRDYECRECGEVGHGRIGPLPRLCHDCATERCAFEWTRRCRARGLRVRVLTVRK